MGGPRDYPWAVHLTWKLLQADPAVLTLIAKDPFRGAPPRFLRVELYRYRFAPRGAPAWWTRERVAAWLPPVSRDNEELQIYLRRQGWLHDRTLGASGINSRRKRAFVTAFRISTYVESFRSLYRLACKTSP